MVTALFIPADEDRNLELREVQRFEDLQTAVGGWAEAVDIPQLGVTVYVNEEGLLRHLPFNSRALFLRWFHEPRSRKSMLVGDALITGLRDEVNDFTESPSELLDLLTTIQTFSIVLKLSSDRVMRYDQDEKLGQVLFPLISGDPRWMVSGASCPTYFAAAVWAIQLQATWRDADEAYVVPTTKLPDFLRQASTDR